MSIKKLFTDFRSQAKQISDYETEKNTFTDVESVKNAVAIEIKQNTYIPQVDYSEPLNFVRFSSAELFYKGALNKIIDFYPYDGSDAEKNTFFNSLLEGEKYVLDNLYPRFNGLALLSANGWGTLNGSKTSDGYGLPTNLEYITFKGGPHSLSNTANINTLTDNPFNNKYQSSNKYQANPYTFEGLSSDFGSGTRESNLKSNFDTGVTVEFWLNKAAFDNSKTSKEVVFDLWNSGSSGSSDYGRLTIELTGAATGSPFLISVQSGSVLAPISGSSIGNNLTTGSLSTWHHYAFRFYNSGNNFISKLYVDGKLDDTNTYTPHTATARITTTGGPLNNETFTLTDAAGLSVGFIFKTGVTTVDGTKDGANVIIGVNGALGSAAAVGERIRDAINASDAAITAIEETGPLRITLTQNASGPSGNTTVDMSGVTTVTATNFTGGLNRNLGEITTANMIGRIGALLSSPTGSVATAGSGKLSGSIDEFRFWKVSRDSKQIAQNYFVPINGGTNTDVSNTTLGVYYKFNEGITSNNTIDSTVLDYSGRISNGIWTGYDSSARSTDSAIVLAGAATKEYKDPVVYATHPDYVALRVSLIDDGKAYDRDNNTAFVNYAPSWVQDVHDDTENENLKIISHVIGSYFDKMFLLANDIPKFKQLNYTSASYSPFPFASHLPTSMGLYVPDLFVDANIIESLLDRNDTSNFEGKLQDTKNLIYQNLYNNVTNIYKSKGTEKAVRNVLRCFYLDDSLIKFKTYNKNATFDIKSNYKQEIVEKKAIDFDHPDRFSSVIYQRKNSGNVNSSGYISGSDLDGSTTGPEETNGFTMEADILFPNYNIQKINYNKDFLTVSLFGVATAKTGSSAGKDGTDTTFTSRDIGNFQVQLVKSNNSADSVFFKLTSSYDPFPLPTLTSSDFPNIYDNTKWNLSVRVYPSWNDWNTPLASVKSGRTAGAYSVSFRGVNDVLGTTKNSFEVTGSIVNSKGSLFLRAPKRAYVGAQRTNLTGAILHKSDVEILNTRVWAKYINNISLDNHNYGQENSGIKDLYQNLAPIDPVKQTFDLTNFQSLALDWTFNNVTGSDSTGRFIVQDASSGSAEIRSKYSWLGKITGQQHSGYGFGFPASSNNFVVDRRINAFNFIDPEIVASDDMINILSEDDEVFGIDQTVPSYVQSIEKGIYEAVSSEMLTFFAGAIDFNNIIGTPVNRYRARYKDMEKLRETFFRKVTKTTDVEKFIEYYKWFDEAISEIIAQILPASTDIIQPLMNVVESHVLERNKYKTPFPTIETKGDNIDGAIFGRGETEYPYSVGFSPPPRSPRDTTINAKYWKERAERTSVEISSSSPIVDSHREIYRRVINSNPFLSSSLPVLFSKGSKDYQLDAFSRRNFIKTETFKVKHKQVIKGGSNFNENKNIHFAYSATQPAGPVNTEDSKYIPLNVLVSFMGDLAEIPKTGDPKPDWVKTKRHLKVLSGRDYEKGLGYKNTKSSFSFPFSVYETKVKSGYQVQLRNRLTGANVEITNLHNDVYGDDMEQPMQGPFTEYAVGGHQSRHIKLNTGADNTKNRPEAWRILLGTCIDEISSGAIGLVGADYPDPSTRLTGPRAYPFKPHQKAVYFRDMTAKRPVNIKNIKLTTGSTILGNYSNTYEYVQTVGAFSNARHFVDKQPTLPSNVFTKNTNKATSVRTLLDVHRTESGHVQNVEEYSTSYLTGGANKSVFISRFGAPGSIETMTKGYQDFRSSEFSVYNALNYRNLSVIKPTQGPSGTISTPAINGDTTDIQVFDIHGKDYGLVSHLSRHTARFGRDSLFVASPGVSYNELPGFHKVHRNNLTRKKISSYRYIPVYDGFSLNNARSLHWPNAPGNDQNCSLIHTSSTGASTTPETLIQSITGSGRGFSFSFWAKFGNNKTAAEETILGLGCRASNQTFFTIKKSNRAFDGTTRNSFIVSLRTNAQENGALGSSGTTFWEFYTSASLNVTTGWNHYAFTWDAPDNGKLNTFNDALSSASVLYINGVRQHNFDAAAVGGSRAFYSQKTGSAASQIRGHSIFRFGNNFMSIGGDNTNTSDIRSLSASMDEMSFWTTQLTTTQVNTLYNSGVPCDITGAIGTGSLPALSNLWDWLRFESGSEGGGASKTIIGTNNGVFNASTNAVVGFKGESFIPLNLQGENEALTNQLNSAIGFPLTGCVASLIALKETPVFTNDKLFDNFYVQHQIPRSSKQYLWITSSLVSDNGIVGYTPTDFLIRKSDIGEVGNEYVAAYDFVSGTTAGSGLDSGTRIAVRQPGAGGTAASSFLPQSPSLNLNVLESYNFATNTTTFPSESVSAGALYGPNKLSSFANWGDSGQKGLIGSVEDQNIPSIFNMLMSKRGNQHGFNTWNALRQVDNPIFRHEKSNNTITAVDKDGNDDVIITYRLPPVSKRGKPNLINFESVNGSIYTIKATSDNELIYFNSTKMNNVYAPKPNFDNTPDMQIVNIAKTSGYNLNWFIYNQQVYPSLLNEFNSKITNKTGYDNKYWRNDRKARNTADAIFNGAGAANERGRPKNSFVSTSSFGYLVSQSSWPLDAPSNFLTRKGVGVDSTIDVIGTNTYGGTVTSSRDTPFCFAGALTFNIGAPGELQNAYSYYRTGSYTSGAAKIFGPLAPKINGNNAHVKYTNLAIGATVLVKPGLRYMYPHTIGNSFSVKSPYGPPAAGGFAISSSFFTKNDLSASWNRLNQIDIGAGEALWQAGEGAGFFQTVDKETTFVSAPSEPWFNDYDDYKFDLKLMAKGFSILPEYRISENVSSYLKNDELDSPRQPLELEIPHVSGASSKTDAEFFITYSNSEFLKQFLNVKKETLLDATEIRLSCTGAIRFNPYKGFYPAQRTIDLVKEFRQELGENIVGEFFDNIVSPGTASSDRSLIDSDLYFPLTGGVTSNELPGSAPAARAITEKIFQPGLLYNSIKSGIAVDYPFISDFGKVRFQDFSSGSTAAVYTNGNTNGVGSGSWALTFNTSSIETGSFDAFFDSRLPFETLLEPNKHLVGKKYFCESPNPNTGISSLSASYVPNVEPKTYSQLSRNFFGAVPSFFLKDSEFTSLKSDVKTDSFVFSGSEVYMMRVKMNRSTKGARHYRGEIDGLGKVGSNFGKFGAKPFIKTGNTGSFSNSDEQFFQIPQDPMYAAGTRLGSTDPRNAPTASAFAETFTMYSRPSAFGPPVSGRLRFDSGVTTGVVPAGGPPTATGSKDSFSGYNPAYTPPYYDGEAWCDIIFRPQGNKEYKIEDIIAESDFVNWRFDAGRPYLPGSLLKTDRRKFSTRALIADNLTERSSSMAPYGGDLINSSSMQLNSSVNLFGVEKVTFTERDKFGNLVSARPGQSIGQRWVIRPKFETPMMNFNHFKTENVTGFTKPEFFGVASTPKGMWHQFGRIPQKDEGVFLSVDDVPREWLQYHYDVIEFNSKYNAYNVANTGKGLYKRVKSLADLVGFNKGQNKKLGQLKEKTTLREAVIAIPYITEFASETSLPASPKTASSKKFITIPPERFEAALNENIGSAEGDSFEAAGPSVSKQLQKMQKYILPPQFDFINNPDGAIDPFVMYIFEFEYKLDRDDLSYIWQNLAPRDYKKVSFQHQSVAHQLVDAEILNEQILEDNENLRWMIFKVKQKGQEDYWDYVDSQGKGSTRTRVSRINQEGTEQENEYVLRHNWPYDYVSFVEMAKMGVEIKFGDATVEKDFDSQPSLLNAAVTRINPVNTKEVSNQNPAIPSDLTDGSPAAAKAEKAARAAGASKVKAAKGSKASKAAKARSQSSNVSSTSAAATSRAIKTAKQQKARREDS